MRSPPLVRPALTGIPSGPFGPRNHGVGMIDCGRVQNSSVSGQEPTQGSTRSMPASSKSRMLRVATDIPRERAIAAI